MEGEVPKQTVGHNTMRKILTKRWLGTISVILILLFALFFVNKSRTEERSGARAYFKQVYGSKLTSQEKNAEFQKIRRVILSNRPLFPFLFSFMTSRAGSVHVYESPECESLDEDIDYYLGRGQEADAFDLIDEHDEMCGPDGDYTSNWPIEKLYRQ